METRNQSKLKLKRQHYDTENDQNKIQRFASPVKPESESIATKITDINDFCLIKIFEYLDLQSLLSVAIANEWLRPAAREVYKCKFNETTVLIEECENVHPKESFELEESYFITVRGLTMCLKYLRCFGPILSGLSIRYDDSESKRYDYIHQYVNDFCADSLTDISFQKIPNTTIKQFQNVFNNVDCVSVSSGDLTQHLPKIVECFPNLDKLDFENIKIDNRFTLKPFQNLNDLYVNGIECNGSTTK